MALYVDENEYPQNYDWLPQEKQQAIIDTLNETSDSRLRLYRMACSKDFQERADFLERQWQKEYERVYAMMDMLDALGIKVEYDWAGHRNKYFLATYNDAVAENDYYYDIARDAEGDVDEYISGGDYKNE